MTNDQKRALVLQWAESQLGLIEWPTGSNKVKYNDWYYGKTVTEHVGIVKTVKSGIVVTYEGNASQANGGCVMERMPILLGLQALVQRVNLRITPKKAA